MKNSTRPLAAVVAVVGIALAAIAPAARAASRGPGGGTPVNIAINPWVGYEANAAVVGYLLENELGYDRRARRTSRRRSPGRASRPARSTSSSRTGAIPSSREVRRRGQGRPGRRRDGQHRDHRLVRPGWMAEEHPDITDWNNLNKYAELFKTSESGDLGPVPRRRPVVRDERRGPGQEPRPQLQGHLLGRRSGDDHRSPAGRRRTRLRSSAIGASRSG